MNYNKRGEIATLLTLGLVLVGTIITLATSLLFVNNQKTNLALSSKAETQCKFGDWDCATKDCNGQLGCICGKMGKGFCSPGNCQAENRVTGDIGDVCVPNKWDGKGGWGCWGPAVGDAICDPKGAPGTSDSSSTAVETATANNDNATSGVPAPRNGNCYNYSSKANCETNCSQYAANRNETDSSNWYCNATINGKGGASGQYCCYPELSDRPSPRDDGCESTLNLTECKDAHPNKNWVFSNKGGPLCCPPPDTACNSLKTQPTCEAQSKNLNCGWYTACNKCLSGGTKVESACPLPKDAPDYCVGSLSDFQNRCKKINLNADCPDDSSIGCTSQANNANKWCCPPPPAAPPPALSVITVSCTAVDLSRGCNGLSDTNCLDNETKCKNDRLGGTVVCCPKASVVGTGVVPGGGTSSGATIQSSFTSTSQSVTDDSGKKVNVMNIPGIGEVAF